MTGDSHLFEAGRKRSWFSRLAIWVFILSAIFLVFLTILANMGGSNDMLRQSVAQFTGDLFGGRHTEVGVLYEMRFFPSVGVHAANINVYSKKKEEGGYPVVKIGQIESFMSFWDVMMGIPRFKKLYVADVTAIKGFFGREELYIEKIFVDHEMDKGEAFLRGNGTIGSHPWSISVKLAISGKGTSYRYAMDGDLPFILDLADIHAEGVFEKSGSQYAKLNGMNITFNERSITGDLGVYAAGNQLMKLKGTLVEDGESEVVIAPELIFSTAREKHKIAGNLTTKNIRMTKDFETDLAVLSLISRVRTILGYDPVQSILGYFDVFVDNSALDLNIILQDAVWNNAPLHSYNLSYVDEIGRMKIGPVYQDDDMVMPALYGMHIPNSRNYAWVIQDGTIDRAILKNLLNNESTLPVADEPIKVMCGIGKFTRFDNGLAIERFDILTQQQDVFSAKSSVLEGGYPDMVFIKNQGGIDSFKAISLQAEDHDFVQSGFNAAVGGSACSPYVKSSAR